MADPLTPQQQDAVEHASLLVAGREVLVHAEDEYEYGDEYDLAEVPTRRVPQGTIYEAARVGDVERIQQLLEEGGANVNQRDRWDSVPLYYSCLAGDWPPIALASNARPLGDPPCMHFDASLSRFHSCQVGSCSCVSMAG